MANLDKEKTRRKKLESGLASYKKLIAEGSCPTCFQKFIDKTSVDKALEDLEQEVIDAQDVENGLMEEWRVLMVDSGLLLKQPNEIDPELTISGIKVNINRNEKLLADGRKLVAERDEVVARYEERKAINKKRMDVLCDKAGSISRATTKKKIELASDQDNLRYAEFWVEGFGGKGLKSLMFENLMPFITERANHYAEALTDGIIKISISPVTELKSGDQREKISVSAVNSEGAAVYEGNSGGERKRVDLCILLALQDLLVQRSSKSIKLAIFDEVLDQLDSEGIERVVELLKERSQEQPVFIISHSEDLKSFFEDRISLEKVDGITSIQKEAS
jgi:DNA repair exonuclease SbcCD ATPase subunit